jgi:hypothetical protein
MADDSGRTTLAAGKEALIRFFGIIGGIALSAILIQKGIKIRPQETLVVAFAESLQSYR